MIHPTPPGTRDILPEEMRELRALEAALRAAFEAHGYGEVATPTIEYADVLRRGDERYANAAYRFFDERGDLLAMRSDMTIPIARLVSTRMQDAEPPFRLSYFARAYRAVNPQRGQMREFTQAGVELIGAPAPEGTAEVIEVLSAALDAAGLTARSSALATPTSTASCWRSWGWPTRRATASWIDWRRTTWSASSWPSTSSRASTPRPAPPCWRCPRCAAAPRSSNARPSSAGEAVERATAEAARDLRLARRPRGRRPRPPRPRTAAGPRLLHRGDPRGLRPGPRPHPRRRRPLRHAARAIRAGAARGRLRPLPGAAARRTDRGGAQGEGEER